MKRFASILLALVMLFSLAACGKDGLDLKPGSGDVITAEDGTAIGYVGDTMSTAWFDFVVDDVYSCSEYSGYTPEPGYKLVVASITLKNDCGYSVDMWVDDFLILWDDEENGIDIPLPAGISDDQFPDEYVLGINATKTYTAIYEVPEEYRDFSIMFVEVFEDGEGDYFFVDFTAEEK